MSKEAMKLALETAEGILNADWRKWDELASPAEFERWAKSRAYFMATILREALAQPEQEPVKYSDYEPDGVHHNKPPQRTFVGLTDEEIEQLEQDTCAMDFPETVLAIEAKLKQKNGYAEEKNT